MDLKERIFTLQQAFPFWDKLSSNQQDKLINSAAKMEYKRGSHIHSGDNDCIGILVVKKGMLRTYMLSEEGKEITLYRFYDGEVCILSASCILEHITFDVYIDAESDSEILTIPSPVFNEILKENIYVENFSYKVAVDRFSDVMWAMQQILLMNFDRRLAVFLIDELSKNKGDIIKLTHEQIAKYIGSAREVVTRMLKYFSNEGMVELSRGGIKVLNKQKLKELI